MTRSYHTIFNLLALSIIIFIAVDVFYTIVRGKLSPVNAKKIIMPLKPEVKKRQRPPLTDYRLIIESKIFGSAEKKVEEVKPEVIEALEPTTLKVVLLGTATSDPQNTVAVIMDPRKRKQDFYRVGDSIQDAVVKKILRGKVIIRVKGKDEILIMEKGTKEKDIRPEPKRRSPPARPKRRKAGRRVSRSNLQGSRQSINKLLSQVRIRPHFKGGKADGLLLTRIKAGSVFAKMGLKNGDILQGVDGRSIKRPDDMLELYKKLESASQVSLEITRRGEQETIDYRLR